MKKYLRVLAISVILLMPVAARASLLPMMLAAIKSTLPTYPYQNTTYSTPGTYTFVVPANCYSLSAWVIGAAGGGGGSGDTQGCASGTNGTNGAPSSVANGGTTLVEAAAGALGTAGTCSGNGTNGTDGSVGTDIGSGLTPEVGATSWGAGGDGDSNALGGNGGRGNAMYGAIAVTPGESLTVVVGAGGAGGNNATGGNAPNGQNGFVTFSWGSPTNQTTWVENWSAGDMTNNWAVFAGDNWSYQANDGLMGSNFIRFENHTGASSWGTGVGVGAVCNKYFKPGTPASISMNVRLHLGGTPSSSNWEWWSGILYTDESAYGGACNNVNVASAYAWGGTSSASPNFALAYDTVYPVTVSYDGSGLITTQWGSHPPIFIASSNVLNVPFTTYLLGTLNAGSETTYYVDIGAVTLTGDMDCWAMMGSNGFVSAPGNFSDEDGKEAQPWSSNAGGLTAITNAPQDRNIYDTATHHKSWYTHTGWPSSGTNYQLATFNATLPSIVAPTGEKYNKMYVYGAARSGGAAVIHLRYTSDNSLVPDTLVPGNSTGLSILGQPLTYDVSAISYTTPFYIDVEGDNTSTASPAGSSSAPVILNGVEVDFQPQ